MEFSQKVPRFSLCRTFCENSSESSTVLFLWKVHRKFHGFVSVKFPEEFPQKVPVTRFCFIGISQKVPRFSLCGNFCENLSVSSAVLSLWKFHRKFHSFVSVELSVEISQKVPQFCRCGNSTESSTVLCRASWILPSNRCVHTFNSLILYRN